MQRIKILKQTDTLTKFVYVDDDGFIKTELSKCCFRPIKAVRILNTKTFKERYGKTYMSY